MALQSLKPLSSSNPSLVGAGKVKRTKNTSPFLSMANGEYQRYRRSLLPKLAQRRIEQSQDKSRARREAMDRQKARAEGDITYKVQRAAKPNSEGLVYYWQERQGGKFGKRQFISENIARAVASEEDAARLWGE